MAAIACLRLWARWLRQFSFSSAPYLLQHFVRRPGRVTVDVDELLIELEPRPLDMVIEMAGYTSELEQVPWLGGRRVRFTMRGV